MCVYMYVCVQFSAHKTEIINRTLKLLKFVTIR